jgi:SAM-dependent methyltransferase
VTRSFEGLVAEAAAEPVEGWDFSWFQGRPTEERPPWGYARRLVGQLASSSAVLDVQTGGGEVFAEALELAGGARKVSATESWPPNAALARKRLAPFSAVIVEVADDVPLPLPDDHFDLVVSRHPTVVLWPEIARVLRPGGTYLLHTAASFPTPSDS